MDLVNAALSFGYTILPARRGDLCAGVRGPRPGHRLSRLVLTDARIREESSFYWTA
jgi:hypothetical protein